MAFKISESLHKQQVVDKCTGYFHEPFRCSSTLFCGSLYKKTKSYSSRYWYILGSGHTLTTRHASAVGTYSSSLEFNNYLQPLNLCGKIVMKA